MLKDKLLPDFCHGFFWSEENEKHPLKIISIPDYTIPQTRLRDDSSSRMVKRKTIQDISREIPMYPDPIYIPSPKAPEIP